VKASMDRCNACEGNLSVSKNCENLCTFAVGLLLSMTSANVAEVMTIQQMPYFSRHHVDT